MLTSGGCEWEPARGRHLHLEELSSILQQLVGAVVGGGKDSEHWLTLRKLPVFLRRIEKLETGDFNEHLGFLTIV